MILKLWRLLALPVILGILILAAYLYFYLGAYKDVVVDVKERPVTEVLYKVHRGPYHQINSVIIEVENWAKEKQINCTRTFGEYLDDPRQMDEARLRSHAGCVLEEPLKVNTLPEDMIAGTLPAGKFVHTIFTGSPAIGPWKVYPRLFDYVAQQKLKTSTSSIEIYQINAEGKMITEYLLPLLP